ncbi:hypothetical protein [Mesocricetibacter intestinalis]|uniref:hypothetical protein n=1 Tax=Mesocricetibacter intestinalis TaxID=1521930 RepID=UPI00105FF6BB|nr:hypothetical protein [Mesocricetibacter intestinalis]
MSALLNLFYLYDPWLFHFLRMSFVAGGIALCWLGYRLYAKKLPAGIAVPKDSLLVLIGLILLSLVPLAVNGTTDFSVFLMYVKALLLFLFGLALYNLCYAQEGGQHRLIADLQKGIILQALVGLLALCGISFVIDFALSTNVPLPRFYGSEQEYRLYNITSSAFFQLSAFYLMLLHFLLAYNQKHNSISSFYLLLLLFIGLLSGRTFFMFSLLSVLLYFKLRYIPALVVFMALVLFIAKCYPHNPYVAHALEPVINLLNGGKSVSSSTDTLMQKHLFIPTLQQMISGDGYYFTAQKSYYGGTDSGFLRQILYGGLGYCFVCFAFTAYFVRKIALNWFDGSWKFTLSALGLLSILNIKADTYAFPGIMLIMLMFLSLFGTDGSRMILFQQQRN